MLPMIPLPYFLFWAFWAFWLLLAIKPRDRKKWWLENILLFATVPFIIWTFRLNLLSTLSVWAIFCFAVLHSFAAHYTYPKMPLGEWLRRSFHLERNPYDRIVHFLHGALMVPVTADVFQHQLPSAGFIRALFIFSVIVMFGALYEIGEFGSVVILGKKKGLSFLGVQGDIWDAQKDMLMQSIGAAAMLIFLAFR